MSRLGRVRRWLRWFLHGEFSWAWLRPRRSALPAATFFGLCALTALHPPVARFEDPCRTPPSCRELLAQQAAQEPLALAGTGGVHLLAIVVVYALAVGLTSFVGHWVDPRERAPRLFDPDGTQLSALGAVLTAALLAYAAGVTGAVYTALGVGALYVLFFPLFVLPVGVVRVLDALPSLPEPLTAVTLFVVGVPLLVSIPTAQVLWLYALAHGAAEAVRTEAHADRSGDHPTDRHPDD